MPRRGDTPASSLGPSENLTEDPNEDWRPILEGRDAERALAAARQIANELVRLGEAQRGEGGTDDLSLHAGRSGIALLFAYLARSSDTPAERDLWQERAIDELSDCIDAMPKAAMSAELLGGFPGVAWCVEHVGALLAELDGEAPDERIDLNADVDEILLGRLGESPWTRAYDLVSGLVGLGVYFYERQPRSAATVGIERVLARLGEIAEQNAEGLTWRTPVDRIPASSGPTADPAGAFNLGLAHGVPGVVAFLATACRLPAVAPEAHRLLEEALPWLLARQQPGPEPSAFPYWYLPDQPAEECRAAWCYGDPGVALSLLRAAEATGDRSLNEQAVKIASRSLRRELSASGVIEAGLCHGSGGLSLIYQRLAELTGRLELIEGARRWALQTLAFCRPGSGIAGYRYKNVFDGETLYRDEPGLLVGATGVALSLLAAATPVAPDWDRCLLLSTRPGQNQRSAGLA